jgi:hypothetical protein
MGALSEQGLALRLTQASRVRKGCRAGLGFREVCSLAWQRLEREQGCSAKKTQHGEKIIKALNKAVQTGS